jgi:ABC-type transport system substrate-binding protein
MPKFEFDLTRAERLLNDAGWTRGPNRTFQNAAGQPFVMDITASAQADNIKEIETLAASWTAWGIPSSPVPFPPAATNTDELKATYPGMLVWPASSLSNAIEGFSSDQIPSAATRWKGRNYGGYSSPAYDRLYAEYSGTLDPEKGQSLLADLMKVAGDDVAAIPMYYAALGLAYRSAVTGPGPVAPNQAANAWNIHEWAVR